jgi:hypothetical protein
MVGVVALSRPHLGPSLFVTPLGVNKKKKYNFSFFIIFFMAIIEKIYETVILL